MIDTTTADLFRYLYAILAVLTCTGFATTLVMRWDVLHPGEKMLRIGLIAEHMVIIYAAYTALNEDYPPTPIGIGLTVSLTVVVGGFAVWIADLLVHGDRGPQRLTDRRP